MVDINNAEATREKLTRRLFVNKKGEESARVGTDSVGLRITFVELDETVECNFDDLEGFDSIPEGIARQCFGYGVLKKLTEAFGSAKLSVNDKLETCRGVWESLQAGAWGAEREGGPRTSIIVEAVARFYSSIGKPMDDAAKAKLAKRLYDEEITSKDLLANDGVRAAYDAIQLERAQARAAKSAEKAKSTSDDLDSLLN